MASVDQLAGKYSAQLSTLQAIFPTWDEGDLVFTLQDTKGNVEEAVLAITEGEYKYVQRVLSNSALLSADRLGVWLRCASSSSFESLALGRRGAMTQLLSFAPHHGAVRSTSDCNLFCPYLKHS